MIENIAPLALVTCGVSAGVITISDDSRIRIILLAMQYTCITILSSLSIPLRIAIIKLAAGFMVCIILGLTYKQKEFIETEIGGRGLPTGWIFRILAVLLVSTSALGLGGAPFLQVSGIHSISLASSILLIGLGLLQLGLTDRPLGIGIGLITLMSGFEIVYSAFEPSLAIMGLIASIHLGIAIVISVLEVDVKAPLDSELVE